MKVLFVCVQGLSSAIVVSSLKKQAKKENIDMDILAVSIREFEKEIENGCNLAVNTAGSQTHILLRKYWRKESFRLGLRFIR